MIYFPGVELFLRKGTHEVIEGYPLGV
jgi:hypothetical protein